MNKKIIIVGSSNTDMIIKAPRIPKPGETILGGDFTTASGGKGANQAVAAARAGGEVIFVACVGDDVFGSQAVKSFQKDRIDTRFVKVDPESPSGVALIFVDDEGENSIAVASGANAKLFPGDIRSAKSIFTDAAVMVAQLETPMDTIREAILLAYDHHVTTVLNPAPAQLLDDELLKHISILTPNETETELLTGVHVDSESTAKQAAVKLMAKGIETVIITMGPQGSFVANGGDFYMVPGFKVKAVDTTAAGDVYNGALAVALSAGEKLYDAVVFASAAAALSVTKLGAQPSAPVKEEIEAFLKNNN